MELVFSVFSKIGIISTNIVIFIQKVIVTHREESYIWLLLLINLKNNFI